MQVLSPTATDVNHTILVVDLFAGEASILVRQPDDSQSASGAPRPPNLDRGCNGTDIEEAESLGQMFVDGEFFDIEFEDGLYYLRHPKWSLVGAGEDLFDAGVDLLNEARDLFPVFANLQPAELSASALRFRDYLYRVASV